MSSQSRARSIGDQELALLRYVSDTGSATVAEAHAGFGAPRRLARSTVLTMMERLRQKGYLGRKQHGGVYRYTPRTAAGSAVRQAIHSFVERTLGGSVTPFVAYLAEREDFSEDELEDLEAFIARVQRERVRKR